MAWACKWANEEYFQVSQWWKVYILAVDPTRFWLTSFMRNQLNKRLLQQVTKQINIRRNATTHTNKNVVTPYSRLQPQPLTLLNNRQIIIHMAQ